MNGRIRWKLRFLAFHWLHGKAMQRDDNTKEIALQSANTRIFVAALIELPSFCASQHLGSFNEKSRFWN
jgi:hypothetical protein